MEKLRNFIFGEADDRSAEKQANAIQLFVGLAGGIAVGLAIIFLIGGSMPYIEQFLEAKASFEAQMQQMAEQKHVTVVAVNPATNAPVENTPAEPISKPPRPKMKPVEGILEIELHKPEPKEEINGEEAKRIF